MKDREPSFEAREEQADAFSFIIAKIKDTDRPSEKSIARAFSELRDKPFGVARTDGETFQPGQSLSFCAARLAILRDGIIHTPTLGMVNNREEGNKFFALLKKRTQDIPDVVNQFAPLQSLAMQQLQDTDAITAAALLYYKDSNTGTDVIEIAYPKSFMTLPILEALPFPKEMQLNESTRRDIAYSISGSFLKTAPMGHRATFIEFPAR